MNIVEPKLLNVKYFIVALALLGTVIFVALAKNTSQKTAKEIKNPRLVVKKRERLLKLFDSEKLVKTYHVALGFAPVGDKEKQGDGKTPEDSRQIILTVLKNIKIVWQIYPNAIFVITFFDSKANELVNVFSEGTLNTRREAYDLLTAIDPKRNIYQKIIATN